MTPDLVNGLFELCGGLLLWTNVRALHKAKRFEGVAIAPTAFFAAWGVWNLFYYPHLGQTLSFVGGLVVVSANIVWVAQMVYYKGR